MCLSSFIEDFLITATILFQAIRFPSPDPVKISKGSNETF